LNTALYVLWNSESPMVKQRLFNCTRNPEMPWPEKPHAEPVSCTVGAGGCTERPGIHIEI